MPLPSHRRETEAREAFLRALLRGISSFACPLLLLLVCLHEPTAARGDISFTRKASDRDTSSKTLQIPNLKPPSIFSLDLKEPYQLSGDLNGLQKIRLKHTISNQESNSYILDSQRKNEEKEEEEGDYVNFSNELDHRIVPFQKNSEENEEDKIGDISEVEEKLNGRLQEEYYEYEEETEEEDKDYDWSLDRYKKKPNFMRHKLFTDIYTPGFIIENEELCSSSPRVMVFINSSPSHKNIRKAIRSSYGKTLKRNRVPYAFLLGNGDDMRMKKSLLKENKVYRDLVVGRSVDSYANLTVKTAHALDWVQRRCPSAQYLVKIDDDVHLSVHKLFGILERPRNRTVLGKICRLCIPFLPPRELMAFGADNFVVTRRHFPSIRYPEFAMGPTYVITTDLIPLLLEEAEAMDYLEYYEDVFWTGIAVAWINEAIAENSTDFSPQVKRLDVTNWRTERSSVTPVRVDAENFVTVHNIDWEKDQHLIAHLLDHD